MIEQPFENWLSIPDYEGLYEIDTFGNIRSMKRNIILKPMTDKKGYKKIGLHKKGKIKFFSIHRLVAQAFIPNPNNFLVINHKDGNPFNNYVGNLEWCTQSYNIQHAYDTGLKKGVSAEHKGIYNPNVKLTEEDVLNILNDKKNGIKEKESYKKYKDKITFKGFENVWFGYTWKNLVEKVD